MHFLKLYLFFFFLNFCSLLFKLIFTIVKETLHVLKSVCLFDSCNVPLLKRPGLELFNEIRVFFAQQQK